LSEGAVGPADSHQEDGTVRELLKRGTGIQRSVLTAQKRSEIMAGTKRAKIIYGLVKLADIGPTTVPKQVNIWRLKRRTLGRGRRTKRWGSEKKQFPGGTGATWGRGKKMGTNINSREVVLRKFSKTYVDAKRRGGKV